MEDLFKAIEKIKNKCYGSAINFIERYINEYHSDLNEVKRKLESIMEKKYTVEYCRENPVAIQYYNTGERDTIEDDILGFPPQRISYLTKGNINLYFLSVYGKCMLSPENIYKNNGVEVITAQQFIKDNTMEEKETTFFIKKEISHYVTIHDLPDAQIGTRVEPYDIGYRYEKCGFVGYHDNSKYNFLTGGQVTGSPDIFKPVYKEENREPLFVTEDGKSVSLKDEIWYVANDFKVYFYGPCDFINNAAAHPKLYKYFSTESSAKKYIYDNEKVFSRKEVWQSAIRNSDEAKLLIDKLKLGL